MNPDQLTELALRYATGWNEALVQRLVIGLIGLVVLALVVRALFRRNTGLIALLLWTLFGGLMLLFACIPEKTINAVISTEYMLRVRLAMGAVSLVVLAITLESVRKAKLQERYALLWVATALVMLGCIFFPDAVALLRAVMGMEYGTALATVALVFLAMVAFHFSISFSTMQTKQTRIVQRLANLEARLSDIERKSSASEVNSKKS